MLTEMSDTEPSNVGLVYLPFLFQLQSAKVMSDCEKSGVTCTSNVHPHYSSRPLII